MHSTPCDVPSIFITILGITLNFLGSLMMSIEAIGARRFLLAREEQRRTGMRLAQLALTAAVNTAATYVLFSVLSLILLTAFDRILGFSARFLMSWLTYFLWAVLAWAARQLHHVVERISPATVFPSWRHAGCLVTIPLLLVWIPVYLATWVVQVVLRFGFDCPLRMLSEKAVVPCVDRLLRIIAHEEEEMDRWQFKAPVFYGLVLNSIGFLMQLVGVISELSY
jgi:hypothetical protein